jgi:hypothetical protein
MRVLEMTGITVQEEHRIITGLVEKVGPAI